MGKENKYEIKKYNLEKKDTKENLKQENIWEHVCS